MSMLNAPPKVSRHRELREDAVATASARALTFYERHRTAVIAGAVGLIALLLAVIGWNVWQDRRETRAAEELGTAITAYEAGNYQDALDGTDDAPGLLAIADDYGSTATGQMATFLAADALYQLARYDDALARFEAYDAGDDLLGASALAGQAAIHERAERYDEAADLYERAAAAYPTDATAPEYLLAAARAHEAAGDLGAARAALERVQEEYEESPFAQQVELRLAMLDARAPAES